MLFRSIKIWLMIAGLVLSLLLGYFAIYSYRSSYPVAAGSLRGLALSMVNTIGTLAERDQSLRLLEGFTSPDIAFFAIINPKGELLFHTNPDLVGKRLDDDRYRGVLANLGFQETRVLLGTGETVYEVNAPLQLGEQPLVLRVALHSYQADSIIRRAKIELAILLALLMLGWLLGLLIFRMAKKAELQQEEILRHEQLVKLGTLGAVLAHEVRNPLAGIKGYAQLLKERLASDDERSFASLIEFESIRLEGLVDELLAYSSQEPPVVAPVPLHKVISHAVSLVEKEMVSQLITCQQLIPAEISVSADRDRLLQVILNLLRNSIQAMPDGGSITISASQQTDRVNLELKDTGTGISTADQEKIFEPFYTSKARGSGLGLAICRKYLQEMHGTIKVFSQAGDGSTFFLTLPAAKAK